MKKNQSGFAHLILVVVLVVGVLVATVALYISRANKTKTVTSSESSLATPLPDNLLSVADVKELAIKEAPGNELSSVELENEHGVYVYKVKLANGTVLFFNAQTGAKVTRESTEVENETEDGVIPAAFVAGITFDKAREIALAAKQGGVIAKIELESEEGKIVYSVRFSDGARIDVDAANGAVIRTKPAQSTTTSSPSSTPTSSGTSGSSGSGSNSGSGSSGSGSSGSSDSSESHSGSGSSGDDSRDDD